MPGGRFWKALRVRVAGPLLSSAGQGINIEHGAFFGDGSQVSLGSRSGIGVNCQLHGPVSIGDDVMMGPDVAVYARNHRFSDLSRPMIDQGFAEAEPVHIGDDVWIGRGATILPGITVGSHSVVGAGAVVVKDVEPFHIVGGNPARVVGDRRSNKP